MFSDDTLMQNLVLKGGNALDLIYKLSARSSVDVDFSMQGDFPGGREAFRDKVQASLTQTYAEAGLRAFDFKVEDRPENIRESLKSFWGGYNIDFKLIEEAKYKQFSDDLEALRRNAIDLGKGSQFLIDVSRHFDFARCETRMKAAALEPRPKYAVRPSGVNAGAVSCAAPEITPGAKI